MPKRKADRPRTLDGAAQALVLAHVETARRQALTHWRRCGYRVPLEELEGHALLVLSEAARLYVSVRGPFSHYLARSIKNQLWRFIDTWLRNGRLDFPRFSELEGTFADGDRRVFDPVDLHTPDAGHAPAVNELLARVKLLLHPRQWQVLYQRYALGYILEECAADLGITRERVRQIEDQAFARLSRLLPYDDRARLMGKESL